MSASEAGTPPPSIRPAVAVLVSRFPRVTETFILREIDELERQGQPVRLVPLLREDPPVVHPEARPWIARALYTPFLSPAICLSNLRALRRRPRRYLGLLGRLILGTLHRPGVLVRTLALFPKSVHLGERLAAEGIEHLHAHFATYPATAAWAASRLFDLSFSFTVHAHDLFVERALLEPKVAAARFVRVISRFNRDFLARLYPEHEQKVEVIHVGIAPARYAGAKSVRKEARNRLLCVAALKPYKGIPVLLEACQELVRRGRDFVCEVVGEGPQRRALEREIRRRGLEGRVRLLGARPQGEVRALLARADLFVLPSVVARDGQMEGIPVVLMEALASRRPVVSTRISGIPELVEDGETGLLVEPGDPPALAAAITRLLDDRELAARLAEAGRSRVEREFRLRDTAAELAALLSQHSGIRRLHRSPDALVAELILPRSEGSPGEVVVKRPLDRPGQSRPPRERGSWEHRVLTRLHAAGVAVPRPIGLCGESGVLVLEAVSGVPLDELIRRRRWAGPVRFAELATAFRATGIWLRTLQEATRSGDRVGRHGDLWPGNVRVLTGGDRVVVLDLEGFEDSAAPEDDAAHFLFTAGLYLAYPFLGSRLRRLEEAFVDGWRPEGLSAGEMQALERARAGEIRRYREGGPS